MSTSVVGNISPFEAMFHTKPKYSLIKIFEYECYPFLRPYNAHKFGYHSSNCVLLGLSAFHKGYLCISHTDRIYIARHVNFNENFFPFENDIRFKENYVLHTKDTNYTQVDTNYLNITDETVSSLNSETTGHSYQDIVNDNISHPQESISDTYTQAPNTTNT